MSMLNSKCRHFLINFQDVVFEIFLNNFFKKISGKIQKHFLFEPVNI